MSDSKLIPANFDDDGNLQCPVCDNTYFKMGPESGESRNLECMQCESRWNFLTNLDKLEPINEAAADHLNLAAA